MKLSIVIVLILFSRGSTEPVVLLTAPTGKAANLLGKRAGLAGFTLHSVILRYVQLDKARNP